MGSEPNSDGTSGSGKSIVSNLDPTPFLRRAGAQIPLGSLRFP